VLERVRVLRWQGDAAVHAGGRSVEIGVETTVVPLRWARSRSWLRSDGPAKSRTMLITEEGGWIGRARSSEKMPAAFYAHERAQFAIYGLMLLAPLLQPGVRLRSGEAQGGLLPLHAEHPAAPPTLLLFEPDGRLAEAQNQVPDAEGGADISQRFIFSPETMPGPVRWPRRLTLLQRGQPYFELALTRFEAVRA
jgi:hypothetical protein